MQKGLILHAIPFLDEHPKARKCRKKWVDFVKQKRAKWETTLNSSICLKHFTEDDYIGCFTYVDEVTNKPIVPMLKRDEIGITTVPSVHAEAVTKTLVVSENAKCRLERVVTLKNLFQLFRTLLFIFTVNIVNATGMLCNTVQLCTHSCSYHSARKTLHALLYLHAALEFVRVLYILHTAYTTFALENEPAV